MKAQPGDADADAGADAGDVALRLFLERAQEAILITNARGTIVAASPPALDLLRLPEEAVGGLDVRTFLPELPDAPREKRRRSRRRGLTGLPSRSSLPRRASVRTGTA